METRLRVAAISFLNPAPLLYNFEHTPARNALAKRYDVRYTVPSQCAEQLRTAEASLGLVPIGALPFLPEVAVVEGCTIAAPDRVRSIQLVLRPGVELGAIRSLAADAASRSSAAYVQTLLRSFHRNAPPVEVCPADLPRMLATHDAALLIGDAALLALEERDRHGALAACAWIDVAAWWREQTGLPWVAAVWAVRPAGLAQANLSCKQLTSDLLASRDAGLSHIDTIVNDWKDRIAVSPETIHTYLTQNIHYVLDDACLQAIERFFALASSAGVLPAHTLRLL